MSVAVVGSSGGLKAVFLQGVFNGLESGGLVADCYVGASASAVPAACAAALACNAEGRGYTDHLMQVHAAAVDLGATMRQFIDHWIPPRSHLVQQSGMPRLIISACHVNNAAAAEQTQSDKSKRFGRKLLVQIMKKQPQWFADNLTLHLFDTQAEDDALRIRADNMPDILYASLRMLHFAETPAWVDGRPYVDTSYLRTCPALEIAAMGYDDIIVISTEPGQLYADIFQQMAIRDTVNGSRIHIIQPENPMEEMGIGFTECTPDGAIDGFHYGEQLAARFLESWARA